MIKSTKITMGMPIVVYIVDKSADRHSVQKIFHYFTEVDRRFSTYKKNSEISKINKGSIKLSDASAELKKVFKLCEMTKRETNGYFDIHHNGYTDPSGLVKGWAIHNASMMLKKMGFKNFYIDAGSDIQVAGKNEKGEDWTVGIKNPFDESQIVKVLKIKDKGVATSGQYIRGDHIYNPMDGKIDSKIVSLTVVGPNIYEADRFATAVFAMGEKGIYFLEKQKNLEGYMIDKNKIATQTSGFAKFLTD